MRYIKIMRDLRENHDLTQSQVAAILGTSQTMYSRYESEANELPIRHLLVLCDLYKVSANQFLGRTDKQSIKTAQVDSCAVFGGMER